MWLPESLEYALSLRGWCNGNAVQPSPGKPGKSNTFQVRWDKVLPIWRAIRSTAFDENARLDRTIDLMRADLCE